jgi:hypothetical protein
MGPGELSARARLLVDALRAEWRELDRRIDAFDEEFATQARTDETVRLLTSIPGIGSLNATTLAAAIGKAATFGRGRDLAAWLGLVPKQMTTGGKPKLLGINKRGNVYLRKMLIHGSTRCHADALQGRDAAGELAARAAGASACEHRGGGAGCEAGTDGLCGAAQRKAVRDEGCDGGVATKSVAGADPAEAAEEVCRWWKRDGLTVDRRSGNLDTLMALVAAKFMRTRTHGSPSWPGRCSET